MLQIHAMDLNLHPQNKKPERRGEYWMRRRMYMTTQSETNLWCSDLKVNSQFGCSHHEGVQDIVSVSNPAHCQSTQRPIMLLEENGSNLVNIIIYWMKITVYWGVAVPVRWGSRPESGLGGRGQTDHLWWGWRPPYPAPPVSSDCRLVPRQYHRVRREPCGGSLAVTEGYTGAVVHILTHKHFPFPSDVSSRHQTTVTNLNNSCEAELD